MICIIKENNFIIYCVLYIVNINIDCKVLMFDFWFVYIDVSFLKKFINELFILYFL